MFKGSDLLVAALESEGVDRIFGIPGEENLDVVESIDYAVNPRVLIEELRNPAPRLEPA